MNAAERSEGHPSAARAAIDTASRTAVGLLVATALAGAVLVPLLVDARLGADDAGVVFGATWLLSLVPALGGIAVLAWSLARGADGRTALERSLTLVVPVVVVLLVGAPWILSAFGVHVRDTGVGSLVMLALATVPVTAVAVVAAVAARSGRVVGALGPVVVAGAVAAALGWVSMPVVGVIGTAFGWLLAWTAVAVVVAVPRLRAREPSPARSATGA